MGSGPGGHPGVVVVTLTDDVDAVTQAVEAALGAGNEFLFTYSTPTGAFAVFASHYKGQ